MTTPTETKKVPNATETRPPVVVVMGHVDHGKTTLLDYIRKVNTAKREAGGITQSIGAYEIEHNNQRITFIDTPGHEAFSAMRSRGAKIADLAIIVVAVDDSVKPQTLEAIKIVQDAGMPFVVAINKMDKPGVNEDAVKNDLTANNVLLEGYGGNISYQAISATGGTGVEDLLDLVLLTAEVEEFSYDVALPGEGYVLESKMDSRRGASAVLVMKNGTLRKGDALCAGSTCGTAKLMEDFSGQPLTEAIPSQPVLVLGFDNVPKVGELFRVGGVPSDDVKDVTPRNTPAPDAHTLSLILSADTSGSLEALRETIAQLPLPERVHITIVSTSVGEVTDGEVKRGIPTRAMIVAFNSKITKAADNLIRAHHLPVASSKIIYELTTAVEKEIKRLSRTEARGDLEILATFGKKGPREQIIGGRVVSGVIENQATLEIQRDGKELGEAKIVNLQQSKEDAQEVLEGNECGLLVTADEEIRKGDHLLLY